MHEHMQFRIELGFCECTETSGIETEISESCRNIIGAIEIGDSLNLQGSPLLTQFGREIIAAINCSDPCRRS